MSNPERPAMISPWGLGEAVATVWSQDIDAVLSAGRTLAGLGSNNWALTKGAALHAAREICALGFPILGGDAYSLNEGNLIFDYAGWHSDRQDGEAKVDFVKRSEREAVAYISAYPNDAALFSIVPDVHH